LPLGKLVHSAFELECEGGIHFAELPRATGQSSQDATAQLPTSKFLCARKNWLIRT